MSLSPGSRLGPYEILSPIGAGGMGEVWKARDTRLDRTVAIKISLAEFDERFEREARAVAALNHPNICQLYDVGPNYIVMELVEGQAIKGPLPLDQALAIAIQLADALDAAHKKGITHRDLKPANALMTKSGVKVLDFGLAKFERSKAAAMGESVTRMATIQGTIVGTLQYMAPEQLQAKEDVDSRADIFSFGCVLFEMLTGKKAFDGENAASIIAAVMDRPAPSVGDLAPPALDRVLKKCLAKDRENRWQTARDLKDELTWITGGGTEVPLQAKVRATTTPKTWAVAVAALAIALAGLAFVHFREKPAEALMVRSLIAPPDKASFQLGEESLNAASSSAPAVVSPDGRSIVFGAQTADGNSRLYFRPLDSATAQPLAGTEGAINPFWSADSRSIAFGAQGKLKKMEIGGAPPIALADAPSLRGGSWNADGTIVFAPIPRGGLRKVPATGGSVTDVTSVDNSGGVFRHVWPAFLPDGKHFLFLAAASAQGEIRIGSIDAGSGGGTTTVLTKVTSQAVYSQGYLLFLREQTLMAQAFDAKRLTISGEAVPVAENFTTIANTLRASFAASASGVLIFQKSEALFRGLAWFDREGKKTVVAGDPLWLRFPRLSPDGKNLAYSSVSGNEDIWRLDLTRNLRSRITFDPARDYAPQWAPDGRSIAFSSLRSGRADIYRKQTDNAGADELLLADGDNKAPTDWSTDGKYLLYRLQNANGDFDLAVLPAGAGAKPSAFLKTGFNEDQGAFSPDGRWVAYQSDESGRYEIYLTPFPGPGGKRQVSTAGGTGPRWRADGRELYFTAPDNSLMAAEIRLTPDNAETGLIRSFFRAPGGSLFAGPTPDGQRFLMAVPETEGGPGGTMTLIQNWTAGLKK